MQLYTVSMLVELTSQMGEGVSRSGSDLPGGLRGFDPPTSGFDPPIYVSKKARLPHFSLKKRSGGSGFWHPCLAIGEKNEVCGCVK